VRGEPVDSITDPARAAPFGIIEGERCGPRAGGNWIPYVERRTYSEQRHGQVKLQSNRAALAAAQ